MTVTDAKREIAKVLGVKPKAVKISRYKDGLHDRWCGLADVARSGGDSYVSVGFPGETRDSILLLLVAAVKGAAPPP